MKIPNRQINVFPYKRKNAERLIDLARKSAEAQNCFLKFIEGVETAGTENDLLRFVDFDLTDFTFRIDNLITSTFPELMPIEWGFEHGAE
ncbi:MAG: hypothetical protein EX271_12065 [Acidimicrobiales bacterium]|nr:hypothetical protein [Hyphomonadaceae bacterium]RZV36641.1 MAG: hypothetical protein EX271_12065 [Acidimicrobiales bacterium]